MLHKRLITNTCISDDKVNVKNTPLVLLNENIYLQPGKISEDKQTTIE